MTPSQRHLRYHLGQHGFPLVSHQECPGKVQPASWGPFVVTDSLLLLTSGIARVVCVPREELSPRVAHPT